MLIRGDARFLPLVDGCVDCCVSSPPYLGLRDYGVAGQIGLERSYEAYVSELVTVFREVRRVLKAQGTVWMNLGDSYGSGTWAGRKPTQTGKHGYWENVNISERNGFAAKQLMGIPWRVAFALQADGWYLRSDIIWSKPNPMPESVTDRPTKAHEYLFLLTKSERYFYDQAAIYEPYAESTLREVDDGYDGLGLKDYAAAGVQNPSDTKRRIIESIRGRRDTNKTDGFVDIGMSQGRAGVNVERAGRNRRTVWTVETRGYNGAHFATMPEKLVEPCILAGCPLGGKRCDCHEVIDTPLGSGPIDDPSLETGRAGYNRPRRPDEGTRPITRREQRGYAEQLRASVHGAEMATAAGEAYAHYIRTDRAGARPPRPDLLREWLARGWLHEPAPCTHPIEPPGLVLDPFCGSGTVIAVAERLGRRGVGVDLSYQDLAKKRTAQRGIRFDLASEASAGGPRETGAGNDDDCRARVDSL